MLDLIPMKVGDGPFRVLCIGAHCDDIEIGCGGTLLALARRTRNLMIDWAVLSGTQARRKETAAAMRKFIKRHSRGDLVFGEIQDGCFPAAYSDVKAFVEHLKGRPRPDLVFCHCHDDRHQDHRMVNEAVWSSFRDHLVLEYEIPKWDGDLGQPNVYVPLTAGQAREKVDALLGSYRSQASRDWFDRETFMAMLRLRGVECRSASGYAEAFHGRKIRVKGG